MKKSEWNEAMNQIDTDLVDNFMLQQQEIHQRKRKKVLCLRFGMVAACFLLVFAAFAGYLVFGGDQSKVAATIMLDVNPSLEIKVDENERVLEVKALNEDAEIVVGDRDFKNQKAENAVLEIVISMIEHGYIDEVKNAVLLSVDGKDATKADEIRIKLSEMIDNMIPNGNVINQTIDSEQQAEREEMVDLSKQYGITHGKCTIIYKILMKHPQFTFEELVNVPISDLCILMYDSDEFHITGSQKNIITLESAIQTAMDVFELTKENNINQYNTEIHAYGSRLVFAVKLREVIVEENADWVYRVELNPVTGEVLSHHDTRLAATSSRLHTVTEDAIDAYKAMQIACDEIGISVNDGCEIRAMYSEANKWVPEPIGQVETDYAKWVIRVRTADGLVYVYVEAQTGAVKRVVNGLFAQ